MDEIVEAIFTGIIDSDLGIVWQKVTESLEAKLVPSVILNVGMIAAMSEVGRRFESGEYYVPERLMAARAMQARI